MTPPDGSAGDRAFDAMSAREAQDALAKELDAVREDEETPADGDEENVAGASIIEDEADPALTAARAAEALRVAEALIFASAEPVSRDDIARRLPRGADVGDILEALAAHYENRGVVLSAAGGRYSFVTNPDLAAWLVEERRESRRVSRAALETLAIIAYHQPCTRADIEEVRGVAVAKGSLDQLMEIGWVRQRGRRRDAPGRPALYATTQAFLEHFNLETVRDLPGMADLKAAGLLDARLPPDFAIPQPSEAAADDAEEVDDDSVDAPDDGASPEFFQDFEADDGEAVNEETT
ncbi:MAG: SMC-Scp complex subunit ScpB [Parvularculaceae bacterium]